MTATVAAFFAAAPALSDPAPPSGNELRDWCSSTDYQQSAACLAYIAGYIGGLVIGLQLGSTTDQRLCWPKDVTAAQMTLMVEKAAREHPEILNRPAGIIIGRAAFDAYKCQPGQTPVYGQ